MLRHVIRHLTSHFGDLHVWLTHALRVYICMIQVVGFRIQISNCKPQRLAWCYPAADGPVQAHVMAFCKAQEKQAQQESFPCTSSADLQEDGEEPACSSSQQALSRLALSSGRHGIREAMPGLVHIQCWGQGLAGLLLPYRILTPSFCAALLSVQVHHLQALNMILSRWHSLLFAMCIVGNGTLQG